jgi:hypothetical protein
VRGAAFHDDPDDPIAICTATFMLIRGAPPMTNLPRSV